MANKGVAPADLSTGVGKFRLNTNDLVYVEFVPPETGFGDYVHSSDAEIEAYLEQGGDNVSRALGYYYQYLASQAALTASSIVDNDLRVNTEKRAELLTDIADKWFDRADAEDGFAGENDIFDSFSLGSDRYCHGEAAPCRVDCGC